jgi:hypothetical protein
MFRHLGLLIEPSEQCSDAPVQALEFALGNSARISLWYAQTWPEDPRAQAQCKFVAREVLARTEAAALAMGIPCRAAALFSSQPAREVLNAVHRHGCDAIVMVRDRSEMAVPGSQAFDLRARATVPVLTFGIGCTPSRIPALELLRTEYRRHAVGLHQWLCLLSDRDASDESSLREHCAGLREAVEHIRSTVHLLQRRKELTLYGRLRRRVGSVRAEIDEVLLLGQRAHELLGELELMVARPHGGVEAAEVLSVLDRYAQCIWTIRGREEGIIFAAARCQLTAADWERLHAEFVQACLTGDGPKKADWIEQGGPRPETGANRSL